MARPLTTTQDWPPSCSTLTIRKSSRSTLNPSSILTERRRTTASAPPPSGFARPCTSSTRTRDILLVEDALYANAPHLRYIQSYGWSYVLNVKPDSHQSLVRQFAGREASGQVSELRRTDAFGVEHYFAWTSGLCLCDSAIDVRVNYLLYEQTDKKGQVTRWTWITNLELSARAVERVRRAGRSRWQIENETFNTLKNQGYHFEHNYGHGTQNASDRLSRADVLGLHGRSNPATMLGAIPSSARRLADEGQGVGEPAQFVQGAALAHDGSLVSPHGVFVRHPTSIIF
ncbi:MAG: transposase [Acidobacteriota bacterium]|nr:transposase [Acidobacteriota bacterium]